jgi:transcription elongation factor SPT5
MTYEESSVFKGGETNLPNRKIVYCKGDKVRILKGELKNLAGSVISSQENMLTIAPQLKEIESTTLELHISDVCKFFENGDHVKVINGRYNGQTGLVLATDSDTVKVLGDISRDNFTVLAQDLQLTDEVAVGQTFSKKFHVNDVVTLTNETAFGIIVKVEIDCVIAIMDNGDRRVLRAVEINKTFPPKKAICTDKEGNSLSVGDMVKVTSSFSDYKEKLGTVRNTLRQTLFLQNNEFVETQGIFPVKARACLLLGA